MSSSRSHLRGPHADDRTIGEIHDDLDHLTIKSAPANPTVTANGRTFEEHQFINLGWAVHVRLILEALRARGVQVDVSAD